MNERREINFSAHLDEFTLTGSLVMFYMILIFNFELIRQIRCKCVMRTKRKQIEDNDRKFNIIMPAQR